MSDTTANVRTGCGTAQVGGASGSQWQADCESMDGVPEKAT